MTEPICTYNCYPDYTQLDIKFPSVWLMDRTYPNIAIADELRKLADRFEQGRKPE